MGNTLTSPFYTDQITFPTPIEPKNYDSPQSTDINLLSYNIFVRPPFINNNGDDFKDERLEEFLKASKNYDIICLQEMFGSWSYRKENLIESAKRAGFLYHAMPEKPATLSHLFIDAGLLILSRYPIETYEFRAYPYGIGADFLVEKGALYARVKVGDVKLHLYTTHAQATYDGTPKYFLKRAEQFNTFQKFVKETLEKNDYSEQDMVLLTGDFNVNAREAHKLNDEHVDLNIISQDLSKLIQNGSYSEYDAMLNFLSNNNEDEIQDLLHKDNGEHPVTFGDYYIDTNNTMQPRESVLTSKHCLCSAESLDFIFKYVPKGRFENSQGFEFNVKEKLSIKEKSASVDKFLVNGNSFEQLSDHYGVKVTLEYRRNSEFNNEDAETASASPYILRNASRIAELE